MQHRQVIVIWQCIVTARFYRDYYRSFSINHLFRPLFSFFFNSLDDHLAIDGGSDVAVQFVVDDTYSNHNPFHIEDYLSLEIK